MGKTQNQGNKNKDKGKGKAKSNDNEQAKSKGADNIEDQEHNPAHSNSQNKRKMKFFSKTLEQSTLDLFEKLFKDAIKRVDPQAEANISNAKTDLANYDVYQLNSLVNYLEDLLEKILQSEQKCQEKVTEWKQFKPSYSSDSNYAEQESLVRLISDLQQYSNSSLTEFASEQLQKLTNKTSEYRLGDKRLLLEQQYAKYKESFLEEVSLQQELAVLEYREKCEEETDSKLKLIDDIFTTPIRKRPPHFVYHLILLAVSLYVIESNFDVLSNLLDSSIAKVCKPMKQVQEDDNMDAWVAPFILLHCVPMNDRIVAPENSRTLFEETARRGGAYLVMRMHTQEYLFHTDDQDTYIPSGIGGLATVLKAMCTISANVSHNGTFDKKFKDTLRCFEPPAAGADNKTKLRNLYFLVQHNSLVTEARLQKIRSIEKNVAK